ncbi:hypothetical protein D9757_001152 [Collybiopsis confluens]|uniref:Uncharacterized protein n=1 Tax=Collybiopsis confluens TaxID=2823264 RepID=A0A8H5I144_9AGAR|nr:hypothetical protein D9757_001152 [Collybiopsis confluens]
MPPRHPIDIPNEHLPHEEHEIERRLREDYSRITKVAIPPSQFRQQIINTHVQVNEVISEVRAGQALREVDAQVIENDNEMGPNDPRVIDLETGRAAEMHRRQGDENARPPRTWARVKWFAAGGLTILCTAAHVFDVVAFIYDRVHPHATLSLRIDLTWAGKDPSLPHIHDAVTKWVDQSEADFWKSQAIYYIPGTESSLETQLVIVQTVMWMIRESQKLAPLIRWKASEKFNIIDGLEKTYIEKGASAMYESVPSYLHRGEPLNRMAALDCVSLALTSLCDYYRKMAAADARQVVSDRIPRHLSPLFVFQEAALPDLDLAQYARDIMGAWSAKMKMPEGEKSIDELFTCESCKSGTGGPQTKLVLAEWSQISGLIPQPERRTKVEKLMDLFRDTCESVYPLRSEEKIVSHRIACLATSYLSAVPGALVYVRRTNEAQTAFIIEQVQWNITNSKYKIIYKELLQVNPASMIRPAVTLDSSSVATFFARYIFPVASTLSFSIPPPWGIPIAAGFQLLGEVFLSLGDKGSNFATIVTTIMTQTIEALKIMNQVQEIQQASNSIQVFMGWIAQQASLLNTVNSSNQMFIEDLLTDLRAVGDPNHQNLLYSLTILTRDDLCTIMHDECLPLAILAATCLFLSLRIRCQLSAMLAHFAREKRHFEEYDRYTGNFRALTTDYEFRLATFGTLIEQKIQFLIQSRKVLVKDVQYYDSRTQRCSPVQGSFGDDGYAFRDEFKDGDDKTVYKKGNHRWTDGPCDKDEHLESSENDVRTKYSAYVQDLDAKIQEKYANPREVVAKWKDGIAAIRAMMAPLQPPPPSVKEWVDQRPSEDLAGLKQVRYLVEFVNGQGPSPISSGSEFQNIVSEKTPLIEIPIDSTGASTKRHIWRQMVARDGTTKERMLVDKIIDNTTVEWLDIDRE